MRLDQLAVARGFFASRSRARDAIIRACVQVDGKMITKPGYKVGSDAVIKVQDGAQNLVSRAGLKLAAALDHFAIEVAGKTCLDLGASTGGFSQILLSRGAAHIVAIDVGHGQLHPCLAGHPQITLHEGQNARYLERHHLGSHEPQLLVCDVSFISLKIAALPALSLLEVGAQAVLLIKPQFEVGRDALNGQGLVRDKKLITQITQDLYEWLDHVAGWRSCGLIPSPIAGEKGNQEFLLYGIKDRAAAADD